MIKLTFLLATLSVLRFTTLLIIAYLFYIWRTCDHKDSAGVLASLSAPIVNTGIFLIACALVYMPLITSWANASEFGSNIAGYFIYGLVGANFVVEMLINSALATTIVRLIKVAKK